MAKIEEFNDTHLSCIGIKLTFLEKICAAARALREKHSFSRCPLNSSAFSHEGLIDQLEYVEYEGFTHEQAFYGASQNGYGY